MSGDGQMDPHGNEVPLIEMRGITKSFGAIQALRGADLKLMRNEVLGLVGDNAAGKSTLMKTLTGVHHPDSGEILFEGNPVAFESPRAWYRDDLSESRSCSEPRCGCQRVPRPRDNPRVPTRSFSLAR